MLSLIQHAIFGTPLLGLVLGPIVSLLGDLIHRGWGWLDRQAPWAKQLAAVLLSFALVGIVHFLGVAAPPACAETMAEGVSGACQAALASGPFVQSVVAALTAVAFKHGQQRAK